MELPLVLNPEQYITADPHGGQTSIFLAKRYFSALPRDIVFCAGDVGAVWFPDYHTNLEHKKTEDGFIDLRMRKKLLWLCVDGNHENFDRLLGGEFPLVDIYGGKAYKIRDHVFYLKRGEVFDINGVTYFVFGGAMSSDKDPGWYTDAYGKRKKHNGRTEGVDWWPQEVPSEEDYQNACRNLDRVGWKVDYVITHTCPSSQSHLFLRKDETEALEDPTEAMLQQFAERLEFKAWHFGHRHLERKVGKFICHYAHVKKVESGCIEGDYDEKVWW